MKQLLILLGCCVVLSAISGCQSARRGVEVIIEGDGKFPQFLVGRWVADKSGWEFIFEPDGRISSAIIRFGRLKVIPGRQNPITEEKGGEGFIEPGEWTVHYSHFSRELTVKISINKLYMDFDINDNVVEGKSEHVFVGTISEDGQFWQTYWAGLPEYTVHTDGKLNDQLTQQLSLDLAIDLTFRKLPQE
ncbi:MAG: hypothetical protein ACYS1A_08100 [Planctomycetota bacterium]|jgi:hypothetical protein